MQAKDGKNMQMWQPGSCFPFSFLFTFLTNLKVLLISRRPAINISIAEADFLDNCEQQVHSIDALTNGVILLNKRQCLDLTAKLSKAFRNIRELVSHCDPVDFRPALEHLYRILQKAKSLVSDCCHGDWCASSVFQIHNEKAFQEILLDVGLCYDAIYEHAHDASTNEDHRFQQIEDLRESSVFQSASATDVDEDHQTLQKRLSELARQVPNNGTRLQSVLDWLLPRRLSLQQHLAQYLLVKLNSASEQQSPQGKKEEISKSKSSAILWNHGGTEPSGTWGDQRFLGSGAGASGVLSTKWLGIACAKKVFPGRIDGSLFSKEAGILADLNHPRVVKFFCCGNCYHDKRDDCFIAMELMETSLDSLIKQRKEQDQPFSLPVAIDIILQIARGMCYLHEVQVAHRDLKPLNVVVNRLTYPHLEDEYFCVKLVDFGMSKTKVEVHKANTISVRGVGTTFYRAPEVHPKAHPDGEKLKAMWLKADVYSFAVTCAQVLTLQQPYEGVKNLDLYEDLINGVRPDVKDCPRKLTKLLNACWHANPSSRPPFTAICSKLEAFRHNLIRMKKREPFPVRTQFGVEEIRTLRDLGTSSSAPAAASGLCAGSDSKRVEPFSGDPPSKDIPALGPIESTEKLAKAPSSDGKSNARSKPRRRCNNKTGVEKSQSKKTTPELIAMPQDNGGERKKGKGKRIDFDPQLELTKVNSGKRSKRKQALDDSPTDTPAGKAQTETPNTEKKKRRRREGDKKLGEGPRVMEDANLEEWFARTLSEDRTAFQLWNEEDVEKVKLVLRRLPVSVPAAKKSRVRHRKNSRRVASI